MPEGVALARALFGEWRGGFLLARRAGVRAGAGRTLRRG